MRAVTVTIPAPVRGWNTRDPLDKMDAAYATKLVNFFPDQGYVRTRRGSIAHCNTNINAPVKTLVELPLATGNSKFIACVGTRFVDVTTSVPSLLGSAITNPTWHHVVTNNRLVLVNGTDTPQTYNGTTWTTLSVTSSQPSVTLTPSNLVHVSQYKGRLHFTEKDSSFVWSSDPGAYQGPLHRTDYSYLLQRGGRVMYTAPWSRDTGVGLQDYFIIVSSEGEVLVYEGDDPTDATKWAIYARFFLPHPVGGRRGYINLGSDLLIVHRAGITPMSALLAGNSSSTFAAITDNINKAFQQATESYGGSDGWCCAYHSDAPILYVNVPVTNAAEQYVLNPATGAWARYVGMNANVWATLDNNIYYGGQGGIVYRADTGNADSGTAIKAEYNSAYNYFGDRGRIKRFTMVRPHTKAPQGQQFIVGTDVDFANKTLSTPAASVVTSGVWNVGLWDQALWAQSLVTSDDVLSVTAIGRCASLSFGIETKTGIFEVYAASITYEQGGIF